MAQGGRPQPEQLARELKVVLKVGTRPAVLVACLTRLPGLVWLCAADVREDLPYDQAIRIAAAVAAAVDALGDGPYGRAAAALFGTRGSTRGLLQWQRRKEAADELGMEVATFVRHREPRVVQDLAVQVYANDYMNRNSGEGT